MLESLATLKRPRIGRDAAGGVTQDPFTVLFTNVPCSCQQAGSSVRTLYAQRNSFSVCTIYFARDPDAQVNDLLTITPRTGPADDYLVLGNSRLVGKGQLWSVDAELVREPM
jgi:hypothetical protein